MMSAFERTELLLGQNSTKTLSQAHVAVFGAGGVGGGAIEVLARAGIGSVTVIDNDFVSQSNLNRQLLALTLNVGQNKAEAAKNRILSINPDANVTALEMFYLPENAAEIDLSSFDYIIDAIDTVSAKLELIERATALGVPIITALGCGNKLDPTRFEVTDISKTHTDPLARILRKELKKRGIMHLKVLYSSEPAMQPLVNIPQEGGRRTTPGSVPWVPPVAGFIMAGEVVKALLIEK
ncbi:MAG: tRNA threonylcarbamoyladenosine dehydratase [Clostridia bacterium]|nr:tRNA threonylcarbamoyladenosine dehydratase [Clostridia bacterium]